MLNFFSLFQDVLLDFTVQFLIEQGCQCQKKLPFPLPSPVKVLISCHTTLTIVLIGSRKRAKSFVPRFWDTSLNHDNFVLVITKLREQEEFLAYSISYYAARRAGRLCSGVLHATEGEAERHRGGEQQPLGRVHAVGRRGVR